MKRLVIGLLLSVSIVGFAQTGEKNFIDQNYIEVTGKAELEIVPDMIYLKIVLSDKDNKDKLPLPEIEKKVINKLSELDIDVNKDLSLMNFISGLKSDWFKSNVALKKQYQLIVRNTKTLQKVFFEFQNLGISTVSIEKLDHSNIEQYRKDVKVSAIKAAKEKAEMLAIALNQGIGKAIYVQEMEIINQNMSSNVFVRGISSNLKYSANYANADEMGTDIEFEKIKVEGKFLVRFALE
jgi:uncharacterized protein YggE